MALLAAMAELVSAAFGHGLGDSAKFSGTKVTEVGASSAAVVAEAISSEAKTPATSVVQAKNFSDSPIGLRIVAHPPVLRVIANSGADSRQMASLADANERQLLFVKITRG